MIEFKDEAEAMGALDAAFEELKSKHSDIQDELQIAFKLGHLKGIVGDFGLTHGLDKEVPEFLNTLKSRN